MNNPKVPLFLKVTEVNQAKTIDEALEIAKLNFEVEKRKAFVEKANVENTLLRLPNVFGIVRTDNESVLGNVGKTYTPVQNKEVFNLFKPILDQKLATIENAGCLFDGAIVYMLLKVNHQVFRGDRIDNYILLTTSHEGSIPLTMAYTPVRVVCYNTLMSALKKYSTKVILKHTSNVKKRFINITSKFEELISISGVLESELKKLSDFQITDRTLKEFFIQTFCTQEETLKIAQGEFLKNILSKQKLDLLNSVTNYYHTGGAGQAERSLSYGTLYGAYNAITGFYQNHIKYDSEEVKMYDTLYNTESEIMKKSFKAFEVAQNYLETKLTEPLFKQSYLY